MRPTGNPFVCRGCSHFKSEGGKLVNIVDYWDMAGILMQLRVPEEELRRLNFIP